MSQKTLLNLVESTLAKGSVMEMEHAVPMLKLLPFEEIQGNAYSYCVNKTMLDTVKRELGQDVEQGVIEPIKDTVKLEIFTTSSKVDRMMAKFSNINDVLVENQKVSMVSNAYALEKHVIDRLDEYVETEKAGVLHTVEQLDMDVLLEAKADVHGLNETNGAVFCNAKTLRKMKKIASQEVGYMTTMAQFGQNVNAFDNVPVVVSPQIKDGVVYFCKFGSDALHGITNAGLVTYTQDRGVFIITDNEIAMNLVAKTKNSFAKVEFTA